MSLVTVVEDYSDVGRVRQLLTQAGRQHIKVRDEDIVNVFNQITIYSDFSDTIDVAGVWLPDDITHSGTNYASGAVIYPKKGTIVLSQAIPIEYSDVMITYATRDGLSDEDISFNVEMAKGYIQMELWDNTMDYSGASMYHNMARLVMLQIASYYSLLAMNNSNAIQSGYNYRIAEFEIQTKLWGEGMIAETLLNKYWERSWKMLSALKLYQSNPEVPIYVVNRSNSRVKYNGDPNIWNTMTTIDNVTFYNSKSEYGIIMKIVG